MQNAIQQREYSQKETKALCCLSENKEKNKQSSMHHLNLNKIQNSFHGCNKYLITDNYH